MYIYICIYRPPDPRSKNSGGWKCATVGVPWRGVSFSMLSLG